MKVFPEKIKYDESCKRVLSLKWVLAIILKEALEELRNVSVNEIQTMIESDNPHERILGLNVEEISIPDARIVFDLCFQTLIHDQKIVIDLEAQGSRTSYDLKNRACYYGARLLDRQKNHPLGFQKSNYDELKPVVSLWIRTDVHHPKQQKEVIRFNGFIRVIFLYPSDAFDDSREPDAYELLYWLFVSEDPFEVKKEALERRYGILISKEAEKELRNMCTFSEALCERVSVREHARGLAEGHAEGLIDGLEQTTAKHLKSILTKQPQLSLEDAMELLDVPQDLRETIRKTWH